MANINPRNISPEKQFQATRLLKVRTESGLLVQSLPYFFFFSSVCLEPWSMTKDTYSLITYNLLLAWTSMLGILMYPQVMNLPVLKAWSSLDYQQSIKGMGSFVSVFNRLFSKNCVF